MTKPKPTKRAVPPMQPREPLTKKALAAISEYATIKARDLRIHHVMVRYVLEAERMPRQRLYTYLEAQGYRWLPQHGFWEKRKNGKELSNAQDDR